MRATAFLGLVLCMAARSVFAQLTDPPAQLEWKLAPGAFEELCFELDAGRSMRYAFDAGAPLEFNLHWHRGSAIVFPIKRAAVDRRAGVFRSETREAYCLMWTNRGRAPVALRARIDRGD